MSRGKKIVSCPLRVVHVHRGSFLTSFLCPPIIQFLAAAGLVSTATAGVIYALNESVKAADLTLHPPKYPWSHSTLLGSIDINR